MLQENIKQINYSYLNNLNFINKNSTIIDLGANIGDITDFLFKKHQPYIFSYEPNIVCYNHMKNRFASIKKIKVFNYAVSNFNGDSFLYFNKYAKSNNDTRFIEGATLRTDKDNIDVKKKIKVNVVDIKEVLQNHNIIDLIKIDIEGSEYQIMPEIIKQRRKIKRVICETHGNPNGKKINNQHKNKNFTTEYHKLITSLKEHQLYNNWFYEWH